MTIALPPSSPTLRVLSNFKTLHQIELPGVPLAHEYVELNDGWRGTLRFLRRCMHADVLILNIATRELLLAGVLLWLVPLRLKIISVDVLLPRPKTLAARLAAGVKRLLLRRVHRFILYFKDLRGYERFYGIGPERAVYVPFKVNQWEKLDTWPDARPGSDGDFVLCAGRTLRDVRTFVEAMRRAGHPGVLLQQGRETMAAYGTAYWEADADLPDNVRLAFDESPNSETYFDHIARARLVVIPRFRDDITSTGISTYLVAMMLGRCVIIGSGPGADDVLTDQALIVAPEEPAHLAREISRLWRDGSARAEYAERGRAYARALEGARRLQEDILRASIASLGRSVVIEADGRARGGSAASGSLLRDG